MCYINGKTGCSLFSGQDMYNLVQRYDSKFSVSQTDLLPPMEINRLATWIHDLSWICRIEQFIDSNNIQVVRIKEPTEKFFQEQIFVQH